MGQDGHAARLADDLGQVPDLAAFPVDEGRPALVQQFMESRLH